MVIKRIAAVLLTAAMAASLTACNVRTSTFGQASGAEATTTSKTTEPEKSVEQSEETGTE